MTLLEAINKTKLLIEDCENRGEVLYEIYMTHYDVEAIQTLLDYIEKAEKQLERIKSLDISKIIEDIETGQLIPKEKIREKIKELELLKNALPIRTEIPRFIGFLQELLGE